ncbi:MAG TPA: TolC family protein, partial [Candidatus Hydrogenedentes bacterium]|nr:TolC family protein [Candidatus Hydrogenedentota bacterium]
MGDERGVCSMTVQGEVLLRKMSDWCVCGGVALLLVVGAGSCSRYEPRWTPETVRPPASLDTALETIEIADVADIESPAAKDQLPSPLVLSRDDAIRMALTCNRAIAVERYGPAIAETSIPEARAAFDPRVTVSADYGETNTPGTSTTSPRTSSRTLTTDPLQQVATLNSLVSGENDSEPGVRQSRSFGSSARVSEFLPTGTEVYVDAGMDRRTGSSIDGAEYSGSWSVGVNQALLRDFGPSVNLVSLRQAQNSAAESKHAFRDYVQGLVEDVESAYWEFALAQETLRIREFSFELAEQQLDLNKSLIAVGSLAASALVSAEAELAAQKS